jgi:hypothetical protein
MKLKYFLSGIALLVACIIIAGCEPPPTHILYITDESCYARDADGNIIEILWLFPGDRVVWVNTANFEATVQFEDECVFGIEEWTIASGAREIMYVECEEEMTVDYVITPCENPPGTPRAKIPPPPP